MSGTGEREVALRGINWRLARLATHAMRQRAKFPLLCWRAAALLCVLAIAFGMTTSIEAQTYSETVLYSFLGKGDGAQVMTGLVADSQGSLYGTASFGGRGPCADGCGAVYKLQAGGKFSVLHYFGAYPADGVRPQAGLLRDGKGNLYGTTEIGGQCGAGTVFKISPEGSETILHHFCGPSDGALPSAALIHDGAGNLYGTTQQGGGSAEAGTVFKLGPDGTETVLYSFKGGADGENPTGGLAWDDEGSLYGTTIFGGDSCAISGEGCGTVFELSPSGKHTVLHAFAGPPDGALPAYGALVRDSAGNFYGATYEGGDVGCYDGGTFGCGTVYKLDSNRNESVLYAFLGSPDGNYPATNPVIDAAGNLYGTTDFGGIVNEYGIGLGTVFEVTPAGSETVLYSFPGGKYGSSPQAALLLDQSGNLYSTTYLGGISEDCCGIIFKLSPPE